MARYLLQCQKKVAYVLHFWPSKSIWLEASDNRFCVFAYLTALLQPRNTIFAYLTRFLECRFNVFAYLEIPNWVRTSEVFGEKHRTGNRRQRFWGAFGEVLGSFGEALGELWGAIEEALGSFEETEREERQREKERGRERRKKTIYNNSLSFT